MASDTTAHPQQAAPSLGLALAPNRSGPPGAPIAPPSDWRRVFAAARRYRLLVGAVTIVGTAAGLGAARFLKPVYQARATIWIQAAERPGDRAGGDQGPIQSAQLLGTSGGWLDLIRSRIVLDDVVRQSRLYLALKSPADTAAWTTLTVPGEVRPGSYRLEVDSTGRAFTLRDVDADVVLQQGSAGDSVGAVLGFAWVPPAGTLRPGAVLRFQLIALSEAAIVLSDALRIRAAADGYFVRLERRGHDPDLITTTVNAVAHRLVVVAANLKRERLTELSSILQEQRDRAQASLRSAEGALTQFRVRNAVRPSEGPAQGADGRRTTADPTFARYVDLQVAAAALAHDREAIEQVLTSAGDRGVSVDELSMIGAVQRSQELTGALKELSDRQAELRVMSFRYADTHPPVRRLAQQVDTLARYVVPQLARTVMTGLAAREREMQQRADTIAGALQGAPPVALEEVRLERTQENAALLFSNLEQRYNEARLAEVSTVPDVRILEDAVRASRPVVNPAPLLVMLAFGVSLGAGVAGAMLRDRVDPAIRDPLQLTRAMGLPILGAVPHVPEGNGKRRGRGDGKSFVTSNLAQAFAQVGYRTLLIDGDVRCGMLHRSLRGVRRPGLTDALADQVAAGNVVQSTPYPLLSFIGAGSRLHRGPELLCSDVMPRLLTEMRPHFDVILVDSAPLAAGVDPCALGMATGSMLLVLRTGVTDRMIAEAKVQVLQRLPIRLLGVALNDVRPGAAYSYYAYSLAGYQVGDEDPEGAAGTLLLSGSRDDG